MRLFLIMGLLSGMLEISGCSGLILRDNDSTLETTGKVFTRVLGCAATFCTSEIIVSAIKDHEERDEENRNYVRWFRSLSPEQQERERDRQAHLDAARIQALGMIVGSGVFAPTPRLQTNCTTNRIGSQSYTNCN